MIRQYIFESSVDKTNGSDSYWMMMPDDKNMIRDLRHVMRESQSQFWRRFGVTQTQGSRFERSRKIPLPVLLLIRLYLMDIVTDAHLQQARWPDSTGPAR